MKSIIIFLLLFASSLSLAVETLKCSKKETAIVFINGANAAADPEDVPKNRAAVKKLTQDNAPSLTSYHPFPAYTGIINDSVYNHSKGLALDMVESFAQSLMIRLGLSRDSAWKAAYSFFSGFAPSPPEASITPNEQEFLNFQQLEELKNLEIADTNLLKKKIYNEYLSNDYKIVIFSHSQGNLFIDVAHKELLDQAGFLDKQGILGNLKVAAPVHLNFAIPNNQYVINNLDIFLADLTSERKTIDISGSPIDFTKFRAQDFIAHHSLIGTYLNFANLKEEVTQKLIDVAEKLESNCGGGLPVANFFHFVDPFNPLKIYFNGSPSTSPNGLITNYQWSFGGAGSFTSTTFPGSGNYSISLIVTDETGAKSLPQVNVVTVEAGEPPPILLGEICNRTSVYVVFTNDSVNGNVFNLDPNQCHEIHPSTTFEYLMFEPTVGPIGNLTQATIEANTNYEITGNASTGFKLTGTPMSAPL